MTWDIFCTVIDNFGDIGITWRIARQLADEHALAVRLWVDDLQAFQRIRPEVDPGLDRQWLAGVEIRHWSRPLPDVEPGEMVIEALACDLPDEFLARMAQRKPAPVWINLEYLSAENWIDGVHGLPSPHPRLPLVKYFFMPGYSPASGGLIREAWLISRRDAFQADDQARTAFWSTLGLPAETADELRVSLFCYESQSLAGLLATWATDSRPLRVLVPEGRAVAQIAAWFGVLKAKPGTVLQRGRLTLHILPMLDQDTYDRLLWACDLNFVRGEDSCVRAQFAGRPMVWQAYRQSEDAHLAKLAAFLDLYCADLAAEAVTPTREFFAAWNREAEVGTLWPTFCATLPELAVHARQWPEKQSSEPDLAAKLLIFFQKKVK